MPPQNSSITVNLDLSVWEKRWSAQCDYLNGLDAYFRENEEVPRISTLLTLVKGLKVFAEKQMQFFAEGFSNNKLLFGPNCNYPPEAAFDIIIDQIGFDISVIEQAAHQRIRSYKKLESDNKDRVYRALNVADHLAYESLKLAKSANLLRVDTTVVAYLNKSANIRVIPYAPVVLVGIPYTCLSVNRDFLAIPHEVGHHVYRHGRFQKNGKLLEKQLPSALLPNGINQWVKDWFEEIFSDVYGALVAGPIMGIDFQDLQMAEPIDRFYVDKCSNDHPLPLLRPYIYNIALQSSHEAWTEKLEANWQHYLQLRNDFLPAEIKTEHEGEIERKFKRENGHLYAVKDAITRVSAEFPQIPKKPLDIAVEFVKDLLKQEPAKSWPPNLQPPQIVEGDEETVEDLYTKFDNFVDSLILPLNIPELTIDANNQDMIIDGASLQRKVGTTPFPNRIERVRGKIKEAETISCKEWPFVLAAAGWATRGPDCDGSGGVNNC